MRWLIPCCVTVGLFVAGCKSQPSSFGRNCDDDAQCGSDAPTCVTETAPDYAPGVCANACPANGVCPGTSECHGGSCIACLARIAHTITAGDECACDADCAEGTCNDGVCGVDCSTTPCADGLSCEGTPPTCHACLGNGPMPEGAACSCNLDCGSGLACIGDLCLRSCTFDEMCGADECRYEVLVPPSCSAPDPACAAAGTGVMGDACACNADCGPTAPLCVGALVDGARVGHCSNTCGPEMVVCQAGTRCCSTSPGRSYCLTDDVVTATSATCL